LQQAECAPQYKWRRRDVAPTEVNWFQCDAGEIIRETMFGIARLFANASAALVCYQFAQ
jgi:hypothetical protein